MHKFCLAILVAVLSLVVISEVLSDQATKTQTPCDGNDYCYPDPINQPYFMGKCCNGTCVPGFGARCPGEVSCKRDADCPMGQCCDISSFATITGHCTTDQSKCRTSCQVQSDCNPGMCCSLEAKNGRFGYCGSLATMYCSCESDSDCQAPFRCWPYSAQSSEKTCI